MSTTIYWEPYTLLPHSISAPLGAISVVGLAVVPMGGTIIYSTPYVPAPYEAAVPLGSISLVGLTPIAANGLGRTTVYFEPTVTNNHVITVPIGAVAISTLQPTIALETYDSYDIIVTVEGEIIIQNSDEAIFMACDF